MTIITVITNGKNIKIVFVFIMILLNDIISHKYNEIKKYNGIEIPKNIINIKYLHLWESSLFLKYLNPLSTIFDINIKIIDSANNIYQLNIL